MFRSFNLTVAGALWAPSRNGESVPPTRRVFRFGKPSPTVQSRLGSRNGSDARALDETTYVNRRAMTKRGYYLQIRELRRVWTRPSFAV